jgi:hypothetical protein
MFWSLVAVLLASYATTERFPLLSPSATEPWVGQGPSRTALANYLSAKLAAG